MISFLLFSSAIYILIILYSACKKGLYGRLCREQCSQNCLGGNEKCNHVDGTCSDGCVAGWEGKRCDTGILCTLFINHVAV